MSSTAHQYLAKALGGEWDQYGALGVPTLQLSHHRIHLDLYEESESLTLDNIVVEGERSQGVGSELVLALKGYADKTHKSFFINQIENPGFFSRFEWLGIEQDDPGFPSQGFYLPEEA